MHVFYCKDCESKLTLGNLNRLSDLDGTRLGLYCNNCFPKAEEDIKALRFVEEYKGEDIYQKDGKFSPYWQSSYYFNSVEGARDRIDNNHLAYMPSFAPLHNSLKY